MVRTGEDTFCFIGKWASFQKIVDARPLMIGMLRPVFATGVTQRSDLHSGTVNIHRELVRSCRDIAIA